MFWQQLVAHLQQQLSGKSRHVLSERRSLMLPLSQSALAAHTASCRALRLQMTLHPTWSFMGRVRSCQQARLATQQQSTTSRQQGPAANSYLVRSKGATQLTGFRSTLLAQAHCRPRHCSAWGLLQHRSFCAYLLLAVLCLTAYATVIRTGCNKGRVHVY